MTLIDSSVWIDYFRGTASPAADRLDMLLGAEPILIDDLILAEVLHGFRNDADFDAAKRLLETLECVTLGDSDIGLQAAQHFRVLHGKGITVRKTIDTIIATCCIARGYSLLYSDRDFGTFVKHLGLRSALVPR